MLANPRPSAITGRMPEEPDPPQPSSPEQPGLFGGAGAWQPPTMEEAAQLFPGYEVLRLLGRGGMGAVYQARQIELDRFVALKLLPIEISVDRDFADRFRREARALAKLHHPHIIAVHGFGETSEGHLFFVMEFVEGANLHEIIRQVGLDPDQALSLAGQVCTALAYAHGKGVVHRDIKPANIMVNAEGRVKVADFGLARLTGPATEAFTMTGIVMGTPDYMAPEQMQGMNVDHRADLYSVGVMLYEMLCRQVPQGIFARPSQCIGCDKRLDDIVIRAMQQQPELRYQSSAEMKADLETARTPPPAPPSLPAPIPKRSPLLLYAGLVVALLTAVAGSLLLIQPKPKPPTPATPTPATPIPATPTPATPTPATPTPATPKPEAAPPSTPAPRAATPAPKPPSATGKWLAEQEPQWQAAFANEVSTPFEKNVADLKKRYLTTLAAARGGGELDTESKLLADGGDVPATDEATTLAALKTLRSNYRLNLKNLEADRLAKAKSVVARCDAILGRNQMLLTQSQRLDEALEIKAKRGQLAAAWLKPPLSLSERRLAAATKEQPFVNSLGMKFVPVPGTSGPTGGELILFSVWETREQDYEVFTMEAGLRMFKLGFQHEPTHPVVAVGWEGAVAFCEWLSKKEGRVYRLPTDAEWSVAVGLGVENGSTPEEKSAVVAGYPWGKAWPPPRGAGNFHPQLQVDDFVSTSPVGSFAANVFGLYDLSGNAWEWCEDWYNAKKLGRVQRGGSYRDVSESGLCWSTRHPVDPANRDIGNGFRCVLVVPGGKLAISPLVTPKPESAARNTPAPFTPAPRAATPAPKPPSVTGTWLAEQEPQWQAVFTSEVTAPFEKGVGDLKRQYLKTLAATRGGNELDAERKLVADGGDVPAVDEPATPAALKALRSSYRLSLKNLEADRLAKAKSVVARCDAILGRSQMLLTQSQSLDEALEIKAKRGQLAEVWLKPPMNPSEQKLAAATKEQPFVNSLGMKFVPVPATSRPSGGERILFSVWETREQDYEIFAKDTGRDMYKPAFQHEPTHPVVAMGWEAAMAFCEWLSKKEGRVYRLPTDAEWSVAVGLGVENGNTPEEKSGAVAGYPWGVAWPPGLTHLNNRL